MLKRSVEVASGGTKIIYDLTFPDDFYQEEGSASVTFSPTGEAFAVSQLIYQDLVTLQQNARSNPLEEHTLLRVLANGNLLSCKNCTRWQ